MRTITDHQVNPANDVLTITVMDAPGSGGAHHVYEIDGFTRQVGVDEKPLVLAFQNGPIAEAGVNGITHEVLLAIVADRLRCFQGGPFANPYNAEALAHIEAAQDALQRRTRERMARGVEGTHTL